MKYRVLWTPQAEERLENLLKNADDPDALVGAAQY